MSYPSKFVEFFGPSTWKTLHSIAWNYAEVPESPTPEEKKDVIDFLRLLEKLLPCPSCGVHFGKYMEKNPINADSRDKLVHWLYDLHSDVNRRYGKPNITFEEHKNDYAGWTNEKNKAYHKLPRRKQLQQMADPHFGRLLGTTESMVGQNTDIWIGLVIGLAVIGFLYYRRRVNKHKQDNENENKK